MKSLACVFLFSLFLQSGFSQDAQSTSTAIPHPDVDVIGHVSIDNRSQVVISGVPAYMWFRGCGPTAVGMVLAYYNEHGFSQIFPGSAATLTQQVKDRIASNQHYNSYSLPLDYWPNLLPDLSEPPVGDEHADNCLADFMKTSQSTVSNYWGWSWASNIVGSFNAYIDMFTTYNRSGQFHSFATFSWNMLKSEIDNNYPLVFLVDTDADGYTDHFITVVGYKEEGGINYYGCYHTWDTDLHWYAFSPMSSGVLWGVHSAFTFRLSQPTGQEEASNESGFNVFPVPFDDVLSVSLNHSAFYEVSVYDVSGKKIMHQNTIGQFLSFKTAALPSGVYVVSIINKETGEVLSRKMIKH